MPVDSRNKGKRGELEVVHLLCAAGLSVKRGRQDDGAVGVADIEGLDRWYVEVKRRVALPLGQVTEYDKWLRKAEADADGRIPVVLMRADRGAWWAMMRHPHGWPLIITLECWLYELGYGPEHGCDGTSGDRQ